jgi:hypothetical protein
MTTIQRFSLAMGIAFVVVAVMGFLPFTLMHNNSEMGNGEPAGATTGMANQAPMTHGGDGLTVRAFDGYVLGLFHVNVLHSVAHLLFGILGITAAGSFVLSLWYARLVAVAYVALAVMGLVPGLNMLFGLMPLHGNDVWLHVLIAAAAGYFGFVWARRNRDPLVVAAV